MKIKKSIRILTFHSAFSYGAVLQSFALWKYLDNIYSDVKIVNFRPPNFSLNFSWKNPRIWLKCFQFRFRNKIKKTDLYCATSLRNNCPKCDTFIIGSDQVWNPRITNEFQDIYFGDFIPENINKISYASSFGINDFLKGELENIKKYIHGFRAISVREKQGINVIRNILHQEAECVLDPTFLIDDYSQYVKFGKENKELCLFILDNKSQKPFELAKTIAGKLNLKPKILNKNKPLTGFKTIPMPTIVRFLKEIHNSKFIITNSFHGLVFSIIFNKNFIFVATDNSKISRPLNLLNTLGIEDRLFYSYEDAMDSDLVYCKINYSSINMRLAALKDKSIQFLLKNI